jgi:hypothetical protein
MSASDSLFCFTSNKIDSHPCPNCRAPMLVRINSAGVDLSVRTFECFNCDTRVSVLCEVPRGCAFAADWIKLRWNAPAT